MIIKTKFFYRISGLISLVFFGFAAALAIGAAPARVTAFADDGATGTPDTSWYSGTGLEFTLTTADQLAGFAQLVTGGSEGGNTFFPIIGGSQVKQTVKLGADIDISVYGKGYDGGKGWKPIGSNMDSMVPRQFRAIFDGCGYTVSGLYINRPEAVNQGLFCGLIGGTIKNLAVEGSVTASGAHSTTNMGVGGIVGTANGSSIVNCSFSGAVLGYRNVGGIAGFFSGTDNKSNTIAREMGIIYDDAIENCRTTGSVTAEQNVAGGIAGQLFGGSIRNCYSLSDVTAGAVEQGGSAGGIVGAAGISGATATGNQTNIVNCYSTGKIEAFASVGGIAGSILAGGNKTYILNCAALNPAVKAVSSVGQAARVAYGSGSGYVSSDNISWSGTGTDGGAAFISGGGSVNGAQKPAAEILAAGFFQGVFDAETDGGVWTYATGKLPGFGEAVDAPSFLIDNGDNGGNNNNSGGNNGNSENKDDKDKNGCNKSASVIFALIGLAALAFLKKRGQ